MYIYDSEGRGLGLSEAAKMAEMLFYKLLENRSIAGDKALGYLLFIYVGSHPGGEAVCESVNRGEKMIPIIESYMDSLPKSGLEPNLKKIQTNDPTYLARLALKRIKNGESCQYH